jgi:hypothetical protein
MIERLKAALLPLLVVSLAAVTACGSREDPAKSATTSSHDRCPRSGLDRLRTRNPEAQRRLVPPHPTSALVCRYRETDAFVNGKPAVPLELSERAIGAGPALASLVSTFESLPPARPGAFACPTGVPLHYLVAIRYRDAPTVYVRVSYEGCGYVFNDPAARVYEATDELQSRLDSLLR